MGWADEFLEVTKKNAPNAPTRMLEGSVTGLSPLEVRPDGSSASIKGAKWNADIVKKVQEGDRVLMLHDRTINRYYVVVRFA